MIPLPITEWLNGSLGRSVLIDTVQSTARSSVWRIHAGDRPLVVKAYAEDRPWRCEVHAYRAWTAVLAPYSPRLVAASAEHRCLVLEAMPGLPMKSLRMGSDSGLSAAAALRIYGRAGELARRFRDAAEGPWFGDAASDGAAPAGTCVDPVAFMAADFRQWSVPALAECALDDRERGLASWVDSHLDAYAGMRPVPVNNDYDTGNWLVHHGALSGVIDFEFVRWGVEDETFLPLWTRGYARMCAGAEEAFLSGYGARMDETAQVRKRIAVIKQALVALVCNTRWGTADDVAASRALLRNL